MEAVAVRDYCTCALIESIKQTYLGWNASSSFKAKNFIFDNTLDYGKDVRQ